MPNSVIIRTLDGQLDLTAPQGPKDPKISGGIAGWASITRNRKTALTMYQGHNPFQLVLNFLFDGWANRVSQERPLRILTWMALPPSDGNEPRPVELIGNLPYPSGGPWVIADIVPGDAIWAREGFRLRQEVDVTFLQYIRPDRLAFKVLELGVAPPTSRVIKTVEGDTLRKLATRYLNDPNRARDIADLNGIRDLGAVLKPNTDIRIPINGSPSSTYQGPH